MSERIYRNLIASPLTERVDIRPYGEKLYRRTLISDSSGDLNRIKLERIQPRKEHSNKPGELPIS